MFFLSYLKQNTFLFPLIPRQLVLLLSPLHRNILGRLTFTLQFFFPTSFKCTPMMLLAYHSSETVLKKLGMTSTLWHLVSFQSSSHWPDQQVRLGQLSLPNSLKHFILAFRAFYHLSFPSISLFLFNLLCQCFLMSPDSVLKPLFFSSSFTSPVISFSLMVLNNNLYADNSHISISSLDLSPDL